MIKHEKYTIYCANDGDIVLDIQYERDPAEDLRCPCDEILNDMNLFMGVPKGFVFPKCDICNRRRAAELNNLRAQISAQQSSKAEYEKLYGPIIYKWLEIPPKFSVCTSLDVPFVPMTQTKKLNPEWVSKYGKEGEDK